MIVRAGESWRTPDGHRHWHSVSYGGYYYRHGCWYSPWTVFALPFIIWWWLLLAELWVCAEAVLLLVTAIVVLVALCRHEVGAGQVTVTWLRWNLFIISAREAGG